MNIRQQKFCELYAECGNLMQAYVGAGYVNTPAAYSHAKRLMQRPDCQALVKRISDELRDARIQKVQDRQLWLTSVINDPEQKMSDRLKAADQLSKIQGDYIQKVQVTTGAVFIDDDLERAQSFRSCRRRI